MKFVATLGAVIVLLSLVLRPASAVILAQGNAELNLQAPADDPGWNNVGRVNGGSGVYLGNRWVITAAHVGSGTFRLSDGRTLPMTVGSQLQLNNSQAALGRPDLVLFRLAEDPGLPAVSLSTISPAVGTQVTMIGAGRDKHPTPQGWITQNTAQGLSWIEVPVPQATQVGFDLLSTAHMRWGTNTVSGGSAFRQGESTRTFTTRFDQLGAEFEAQAVTGDSGGGVFQNVGGAWQLNGIMLSMQTLENQPAGSAMFGNQSFIADVAAYQNEIVSRIDRPEPLWQNQVNYYDVVNDGRVNPRDLVKLIDKLVRDGTQELSAAPMPGDNLYDVNGDYRVSPADLSQLISFLISNPPQISPATSSTLLVPEPASAALAAGGGLLAILAGYLRRQRKRGAAHRG